MLDALRAQQPDGVARRLARLVGDADRRRSARPSRPTMTVLQPRAASASSAASMSASTTPAPRTAGGCRRPALRPPSTGLGAAARQGVERLDRQSVPRFASSARATIARPSGCSDRLSSDAARRSTSGAPAPLTGSTSTTCSRPFVSVPVLSKATHRTAASFSSRAPPLMSTPLRAAAASADTIDTGVEITSAHGQEMTSSTSDAVEPGRPGGAGQRAAGPAPRAPPRRAPTACRRARTDRRTSGSARAAPAPARPDG